MPYGVPCPRDKYERRVQEAGYPWVQTVRLHPYDTTDPADHPFRIFDHFGLHGHHSKNTHLIVTGQLTIQTARANARPAVINANTGGPRYKEKVVGPNIKYTGQAGSEGAVFVEGHSILSPATADRFERRGTIVWFEDGSGLNREQWLEKQRQQAERDGVYTNTVDTDGLYRRR